MERQVQGKRIPRRDLVRESYTNHAGDRRSLQDQFLSTAVESETECDIYLKNESVRRGRIAAYDNWSVLLYADGKQYLLFKSSIMSIIPATTLVIQTDPYVRGQNRIAESGSHYMYDSGLM